MICCDAKVIKVMKKAQIVQLVFFQWQSVTEAAKSFS